MIPISYIIKTVCKYFNISPETFQSKTRKREIAQSRQIAMYFAKIYTKESLSTIGYEIGKKDHATVLHAIKTVNNLIDTDKKFKTDIEEINNKLTVFADITRYEIDHAIRKALLERFSTLIAEKNYYEKLMCCD